MSVNLKKGQKVDLTKGNSQLKNIMVGLGWDAVKKSFFSRPQDIDCDASVIMLGADGRIPTKNDVVFYNNLRHISGSIMHQGDNLTGDGDGDDEQILVSLDRIPANFERLVFVVTIYQARQRRQNFGLIKNAFIRLVDADRNQEICKFNLSENYDGQTAMIFGEMYRRNGEWKFNAIGQGTNDDGISEMCSRFQ